MTARRLGLSDCAVCGDSLLPDPAAHECGPWRGRLMGIEEFFETNRELTLPRVAVIIPMSAPAQQCNRLMALLEEAKYVETVALSYAADHVIVMDLDRMRSIVGQQYLREPTLAELQRDRASAVAHGLVALWAEVIR